MAKQRVGIAGFMTGFTVYPHSPRSFRPSQTLSATSQPSDPPHALTQEPRKTYGICSNADILSTACARRRIINTG